MQPDGQRVVAESQFVFRERTVSGRNGRLRGEYGHLGRLRQHHAEDLLQGEDVYA